MTTPLLLHAGASAPALVEQLVDAFGAQRLAWGSDFPQTQSLDYPGMVAQVKQATAGLSAMDRDAILGGTSANLWFNR